MRFFSFQALPFRKNKLIRIFLLGMFFFMHFLGLAQNTFELNSGKIDFKSEAPLELITASSTTFQAIVDTAKGEFALLIPLQNFFGFNSPLQREHFFENYMEVESFANATFSGKILEPIRYSETPFTITLKGQLNIHGVKKQRIIDATCSWLDASTMLIEGAFQVPLADHNIEIPRVVFQKIAEVIDVKVTATLKQTP